MPIPDLVIILAAGCGRRLGRLGENRPKCLLTVKDKPLLQWSLEAIEPYRMTQICVVSGYLHEHINSFLTCWTPRLKIHECHNRDFLTVNNACSLGVSLREHGGRSFLLLDGDLLFDPRLLEALLADPRENVLVVETEKRGLTGEAMKAVLNPANSSLRALGKEIPLQEAHGEYIGMAKFSAEWSVRILQQLEIGTENAGLKNLYYEDVVNLLLPRAPILHGLSTKGFRWAELDTPEDLLQACQDWTAP